MLKVTFGGDIPVHRRAVDALSLALDPDGGTGNLQVTRARSRMPEPLVFGSSEDLMARAAAVAAHAIRVGQAPVVEACDISFEGLRFFHDPEYDQFVLEGREGEILVATSVLPDALRSGSEALRAMARGEAFEPVIGPAPGR